MTTKPKSGCLKRTGQAAVVLLALAVVLVVLALLTDPGEAPTAPPTATSAPTVALPTATPTVAWYAGGTLHSATVGEWRTADDRNKLATAADWVVRSMPEIKTTDIERMAKELVACVDEAAPAASETSTVTDLAATCIILLKAQ